MIWMNKRLNGFSSGTFIIVNFILKCPLMTEKTGHLFVDSYGIVVEFRFYY